MRRATTPVSTVGPRQSNLDSGIECPDLMLIGVTVRDEFLDDSEDAVDVSAASVSSCTLGRTPARRERADVPLRPRFLMRSVGSGVR